jgi:HEAT repeat protein
MVKKEKRTVVQFNHVVSALLDNSKPFSPTMLHRFSDISEEDLAELKAAWQNVNPNRRVALLEDLEELAETDTLVSFDDLAMFALKDPDARARAIGIRLLWESDDRRLIPIFIGIMKNDNDEVVRASAAAALGMFVYIGELESIPAESLQNVENHLLAVYQGSDTPLVRRRALESLGFSSRNEVPDIIRKAYTSGNKEWIASALFAMGRSADEDWADYIVAMLDNIEPDIQIEAVRAAGQLELISAREPLLNMLEEDDLLDEDVRAAVIWSLSQIGGPGVREALSQLSEASEDDEEEEYIDMAIDNLSLAEGVVGFDILGLKDLEKDDLDTIIDLDDDEDDDEYKSLPPSKRKKD